MEASSQCPASPSSKGRRHSPGWACVIYSFPSKPGSVSSFMEHEGRKPGRQTHIQKTNNAGSATPRWVGCREGRWGTETVGMGSGWGRRWGLPRLHLPHPPEALPGRGSRSLSPGGLLSRSIQLALWENWSSMREGQNGSQQRGGWQHGAPALKFPPVLCSHPHRHRQGTRGSPGSKERPKSAELLPQPSYGIKRVQAVGFSG